MDHDFINGMCAERARVALTLLAELQAFNTKEVEAAIGPHKEVLKQAGAALHDIQHSLRVSRGGR